MDSIANITKLAELKKQLAELIKAKQQLPRLSQDDLECCNDNYQMHLELNYEIDGMRDEIKAVERQQGD